MSTKHDTHWGLFGGAGFIGQHLAHSVLSQFPDHSVTLLDIESHPERNWRVDLESFHGNGQLKILDADVRNPDSLAKLSDKFDVIVNLAAIHREPGHRPEEYFETNVKGAENICRLASETGCREIIFTSSISVYGQHDCPLDEQSSPQPYSPYGQSKLKAELIHQTWAMETGGRLLMFRPGVVFGKSERGNVTRLVGEMIKRNRAIMLSPDQPKAGIYIEELLSMIHWFRQFPEIPGNGLLVNGVSNENLTFNSFGKALSARQEFSRSAITVPQSMLKLVSIATRPLKPLFSSASRLHPKRIEKLTLANDVRATRAEQLGYPYAWPLKRALSHWLEQGL